MTNPSQAKSQKRHKESSSEEVKKPRSPAQQEHTRKMAEEYNRRHVENEGDFEHAGALAVYSPEPQGLYEVMRYIANGGDAFTPLQKECKAWMKKNVNAFMLRLSDLELKAAAEQRLGPVPADDFTPAVKWGGKGPCPTCKREPEPPDEGTERAIAMAEKWMQDWNETHRES